MALRILSNISRLEAICDLLTLDFPQVFTIQTTIKYTFFMCPLPFGDQPSDPY